MPTCTVFVGLPALGKSTFIEQILTDDVWVYSTDRFIEAVAEDHGITYSDAFTSNIEAATQFNEQKVKTMFKLGRDIIWDQTNLGKGKRRRIINRAKAAGYEVNCVCLMPPADGHIDDLKEWKRRLESRPGKVIPNHVIANMLESFAVPTEDEGFDRITYYNMWGQEISTQEKSNA